MQNIHYLLLSRWSKLFIRNTYFYFTFHVLLPQIKLHVYPRGYLNERTLCTLMCLHRTVTKKYSLERHTQTLVSQRWKSI
jgi:hypothetical protein